MCHVGTLRSQCKLGIRCEIDLPVPLHPSAEVRVRIVLPGGATITCPGTVTQAEARALAIENEPVDSDRALMQLSAGPEPLRR